MTTAPPELSAATEMALDRTRLAHERTLMAWVRTSASLISFGFTLHKFFQFMRESQSAPLVHHAFGPREFALMMMGIGLTVLLVATLQHQRDVQQLRAKYRTGPVLARHSARRPHLRPRSRRPPCRVVSRLGRPRSFMGP